jgi:hypothetical protein
MRCRGNRILCIDSDPCCENLFKPPKESETPSKTEPNGFANRPTIPLPMPGNGPLNFKFS